MGSADNGSAADSPRTASKEVVVMFMGHSRCDRVAIRSQPVRSRFARLRTASGFANDLQPRAVTVASVEKTDDGDGGLWKPEPVRTASATGVEVTRRFRVLGPIEADRDGDAVVARRTAATPHPRRPA